ncbi:Uncharacterized protein dnl_41520 [Desulfonema limicola]|uniref:Uncharacterized protein n=1 Tax=Desulfonema limicola TaxID=45656 RepID=A0A975BAL6_9BACT|nr:Uncharacterized protein dnl_41520 [Desulfonema limicola]
MIDVKRLLNHVQNYKGDLINSKERFLKSKSIMFFCITGFYS